MSKTATTRAAKAFKRLGAWVYRLDSYDWHSAFSYAGEEGGYGEKRIDPVLTTEDVSLDAFARSDVIRVLGISEGENDENDWIVAGQLDDERYFFLCAGCDYTGWDCQGWGRAVVTMDEHVLRTLGVDQESHERFGWK